MNPDPNRGKVYLVGAGPGNPDLLTRKAFSLLQTSDVVLHDDLVTPEILALVRASGLINVGKRCGTKQISQDQINAEMIRFARAGFIVVRLKGGDPLIFGRAAEEIAALRAARIEFEIVPGITAAAAAAAAARIPLTDRHSAPHLMFTSASHCHESDSIRAGTISSETTLAVYMPGLNYGAIAGDLLAVGLRDSTPCLIVCCASRSREQIRRTSLGELHKVQPLAPPAVLIVGNVAAQFDARDKTTDTRDAERLLSICIASQGNAD